jgi:hypothetical protein
MMRKDEKGSMPNVPENYKTKRVTCEFCKEHFTYPEAMIYWKGESEYLFYHERCRVELRNWLELKGEDTIGVEPRSEGDAHWLDPVTQECWWSCLYKVDLHGRPF